MVVSLPSAGSAWANKRARMGRKTDNGASGTRAQRRPWGALSDILTLDDRAGEPQGAGNPLIMWKSLTAAGCMTAQLSVGFLYISDVPPAPVPGFYHKLRLFIMYGPKVAKWIISRPLVTRRDRYVEAHTPFGPCYRSGARVPCGPGRSSRNPRPDAPRLL